METIQTIDYTLNFIENNRAKAIDALFPGCADDYREEWMQRSVMKFWSNLDLGNRRELVKAALNHYGITPKVQ